MNDHDNLLERELRDTFDALASTYTPVRLPDDLWSSGRSERRTGRVRLLAAVAVIVALLGGLVAVQQTSGALLPAATSKNGALPKNLYVPSDEVVEKVLTRGNGGPAPSNLGRVSVAGITSSGVPLLVSATDGTHHLVVLDDLDLTAALGGAGLTLSPDGWKVAYPVRARYEDRPSEDAGIAVFDLATGGIVTQYLKGRAGAPVQTFDISWSPDSSRLTWLGSEYVPGEGTSDDALWVGVMDDELHDPAQWRVPSGASRGSVVVDNTGTGYLVTDELWTYGHTPSGEPQNAARVLVGEYEASYGAALSADGQQLSVGTSDSVGETANISHVFDLSAPTREPATLEWARDEYGIYVRVLGVTPRGTTVATQTISPGSINSTTESGDDKVLVRILIENASLEDFSVATDLTDRDPVRFAAPPWAPGPPLIFIVLGVLVALLLLGLLGRRLLPRSVDSARRDESEPNRLGRQDASGRLGRWWSEACLTLGWFLLVGLAVALADLPVVGWIPLGAVMVLVLVVRRHLRARRSVLTGTPSRGRTLLRSIPWAPTALAVLVASIVFLSLPWWPAIQSQEVSEGALPQQLYRPPYDRAFEPVPLGEIGVERASAAVITDEAVLLVDAQDGRHHSVALPGRHTMMDRGGAPVVLSPDGTRIAWTWSDVRDRPARTIAGLAVGDLATGVVERVTLSGRNALPIWVEGITWSPDGDHLAWSGDEARWDTTGFQTSGPVRNVGTVSANSLASRQWTLEKGAEAVAVANDGGVVALSGRTMWSFPATRSAGAKPIPPTSRRVSNTNLPWTGATISPAGTTLVVGLNAGGHSDAYASGLRTLDLTDSSSRLQIHPWRELREGASSLPLGWAPTGDLVVAHDAGDILPRAASLNTEVARVSPGTNGWLRLTYSEDVSPSQVSVATDLAGGTAEFRAPVWPMSDERAVLLGVLAIAAFAAAVATGVRLRSWMLRRRRTSVVGPHM